MRNLDKKVTGSLVTTSFNPNVTPPSSSATSLTCGSRLQVGHSAVTSGDRHRPNPWSYSVLDRTYPSGSARQSGLAGRYSTYEGSFATDYSSADPLSLGWASKPVHVYNKALSDLNEKVRGSIDLSVDIAQAGSTARMFNAVDKVQTLAHAYYIVPWRRKVKAISSLWLEFQYGWRPLLQTIYDSAIEASSFVATRATLVKGKSKERVVTGDTQSATYLAAFGTLPGVCNRKGHHFCEIGVRVLNSSGDVNRFTSLNPASIAWELLPFSFVVDWFFDLGSYIRDLETSWLYGTKFVDGYVSQGTAFIGTWVASKRLSSTDFYDLKCSSKVRIFDRTVLDKYPVPRLPRFRAELGSGRLLNAAALLAQFLK